MGNDLKPCPFCGGEVTLDYKDGSNVVGVVCPKESPCNGTGLLVALGDRGNGIDKAIKAWNTRTIDPVLREVDYALDAILEIQDEPCRYDHHGYCQTHHLRTKDGEPECEIMLGRKALEKLRAFQGDK